jgi:hypothetical protein
MLINLLILLFGCLLTYQLYIHIKMQYPLVENLDNLDTNTNTETNTENTTPEYQPYNIDNPNNALILSQQNAGNIEVLKGRINDLDGVKKKVDSIQESVDSMQIQINQLVQQQADYAQELAGSTPPTITGTEEETVEDNF